MVFTGTVTEIKISQVEDLAVIYLLDETGQKEYFILWSPDDQLTQFSTWIARSLIVSLAREALVNKLKVYVVAAGDTSSLVLTLGLLSS